MNAYNNDCNAVKFKNYSKGNMNSSIYNNTRQRKFLNCRSNKVSYIYMKEKSLSF